MPPLALSVRALPEFVEGAASPRMEPKDGDEEHVRSDYPRANWQRILGFRPEKYRA